MLKEKLREPMAIAATRLLRFLSRFVPRNQNKSRAPARAQVVHSPKSDKNDFL